MDGEGIDGIERGVYDFTAEPWTKRVVFREEMDGRCVHNGARESPEGAVFFASHGQVCAQDGRGLHGAAEAQFVK